MARKTIRDFNPKTFLQKSGVGRTLVEFQKKGAIFSQGDVADAVFYIQTGRVKLTIVSPQGKEATIAILGPGNFFGEGCLAGNLFGSPLLPR
jgi:CRP/FNR family transcriptional regulator, cyclic AMP receptor protein